MAAYTRSIKEGTFGRFGSANTTHEDLKKYVFGYIPVVKKD